MPRPRRELPWLERRGHGVYYVFWYDDQAGVTKRLSLRTGDPGEARERYAAFLVQGASIYGPRARSPVGLTVDQALDDYDREHVVPAVVDKERLRNAYKPLRQHFGDTEVRAIDAAICIAYASLRASGGLGRPVKPSTVCRELSTLAAAIRHAVAQKRLPAADAPPIKMPTLDSERAPRWLTHAELRALRDAASLRCRDFIDIAYYTGSRRRAVETLSWFQVDLAAGRIALAKPGERRTKKRRPVVPIAKPLLPVLRRLHAEKTTEWVLGHPGSIRTAFENAVEKADLAGVTPHTLRHTRATHLLQAGVGIWPVAKLLGDTIRTVERTYGHASPTFLEEVLGGVEEIEG